MFRYLKRRSLIRKIKQSLTRFSSNRKYQQNDLDFLLYKAIEECTELSYALHKLQKLNHGDKFKDIKEFYKDKDKTVVIDNIVEETAHVLMYMNHIVQNELHVKNFYDRIEDEIEKKCEFFKNITISKPEECDETIT